MGDLGNDEPSLLAIAFSADEHRLAAAYGYDVQVWDLQQEDPPRHVVGRGRQSGWITSVDLSPDGLWLATASGDTLVELWDLAGSSGTHSFEGAQRGRRFGGF